MADNLFAGTPAVIVAKQNVAFASIGVTPEQVKVIYKVGQTIYSYVPGRAINGFDAMQINQGYYAVPLQNLDWTPWVVPPIEPSPLQNAKIIFDGNSLTFGTGSSDPATKSFPAVIAAMPEVQALGITIVNMGVSGQTTGEMRARAAAEIDVLMEPERRNILIGWEIGNDIWETGSSGGGGPLGQYFAQHWQQYIFERFNADWVDVASIDVPFRNNVPLQGGPLTPGGDTQTQYDNCRVASNSWYKNSFLLPMARLLELTTRPEFQAYDPAYYNSDQLHFNDAGYELIAQIVWDFIKTTYGT